MDDETGIGYHAAMPDFRRSHLPHEVPRWIDPTEEAFFITINCRVRHTNQLALPEVWHGIMDAVEFREQRGDWCWKIVLAMPDHLHGIVTFPHRHFPKRAIADWKRWVAGRYALQWQDGYFEHRLRNWEGASEKADYIRMNPVRGGLVTQVEDWAYVRDWRR